ncbi:MAG: hypothetical protein HY282_09920 [Nitrospirae bacterium]|nr:hypothetical protein [Candidatus Manganitrophaceae bacterium]
MLSRSLLLLIVFFCLNSNSIDAKESYWEEHHITLSDLTEEQQQTLELTINQLKTLESSELKIDKKVYRRLSRFKELFGISFHGREIAEWLLTRMRKVSYGNSWTVAVNQRGGDFMVGDIFFTKLGTLERLYLLIHEARHSDGKGYPHVKCPKGFRTISATQPDLDLEEEPACDDGPEGAYSFQAAFLFELFAYGIFDQKEVGLLYNSSISRVLR